MAFPSAWEVFDTPECPDPAKTFSMRTWVLPKYSADTHGSLADLVQVSPIGQTAHKPWSALCDLEQFVGEIAGLLRSQRSIAEDAELATRTIDDLLRRRAPMVFLKQFPDAADPTKACYMSLVEAPSNMTGFHHGGLVHTQYTVSFAPCESHPIVTDLGLGEAGTRPLLSFFVEFDFEIDSGIENWRA